MNLQSPLRSVSELKYADINNIQIHYHKQEPQFVEKCQLEYSFHYFNGIKGFYNPPKFITFQDGNGESFLIYHQGIARLGEATGYKIKELFKRSNPGITYFILTSQTKKNMYVSFPDYYTAVQHFLANELFIEPSLRRRLLKVQPADKTDFDDLFLIQNVAKIVEVLRVGEEELIYGLGKHTAEAKTGNRMRS